MPGRSCVRSAAAAWGSSTWLCCSDGNFDKEAALKVLPRAASSPEAIGRFEQERRILARLDHPTIARLLDGGVDRRGLPFLVLEYVHGVAVDEFCDRERLTVERRIALVIEIARAVQAAHPVSSSTAT